MKIEMYVKDKLRFNARDWVDERSNEVFNLIQPSQELKNLTEQTIESSLRYLPTKFHPEKIYVILEYSAEVVFSDGKSFSIPMSLVTSQQVPPNSEIRMGMHEMQRDHIAYQSVLAHELGHMVVEWACRKERLVAPDTLILPFWSKPIYEGVADFFSALITSSPIIGSNELWFSRNILEYSTLQEAKTPKQSMSVYLRDGFVKANLVPQHEPYSRFLGFVDEFLKQTNTQDPYAEGTWIAGQLWNEVSQGRATGEVIMEKIIKLALSGAEQMDSEKFVKQVVGSLNSVP